MGTFSEARRLSSDSSQKERLDAIVDTELKGVQKKHSCFDAHWGIRVLIHSWAFVL